MTPKFVLIFVLWTAPSVAAAHVPFETGAQCMSARYDLQAKIGNKLLYAECFSTGVIP